MPFVDTSTMTREQIQAALAQASEEKAALAAIVDPLRAERDAVVAQMHPLEAKADELAEKIKSHMPKMAGIDQRLSALSKALGHPRVGGLPRPFGG